MSAYVWWAVAGLSGNNDLAVYQFRCCERAQNYVLDREYLDGRPYWVVKRQRQHWPIPDDERK